MKGTEKKLEEMIVENFPSAGKEIIKSKKCRVPYRMNPRRNTLRHSEITNQTNRLNTKKEY